MASHSEVAHRWAQDDENGRTIRGFNLFFERRNNGGYGLGDIQTIYSHGMHFPLAAFVTAPDGSRVVLANLSESRSVSTSAHQREVSRAIPSRYVVFDVPNVDPFHSRGIRTLDEMHAANMTALLERAAGHHAKGKRARSDWNKAHLAECAERALSMAMRYAATWGVAAPSGDITALADEITAREAEARRVYAEARKEREQAEAARMKALREDQAAQFAEWLAGADTSRVPSSYSVDENGAAYVRHYGDELQTSQGASVPWEHALKAFRFIALCRAKGQAWARNGHVVRVGHYQIDSIDAEGNMRAGCHAFTWEHMRALAEREGVVMSPSAEAVEARS